MAAGIAPMVFVAAALPYRDLVLYHFYVQGAFLWDTGSCAATIWRHDPWPMNFPMQVDSPLYASHVMPLFTALEIFSWYPPLNLAEFYAALLGVAHALPTLGIFWLLAEGFKLRTFPSLAGAAILAVVFAFNGLALAIIRFPHPEILIAGGMILLLTALVIERPRLTWGLLVFTLSIREDAGFHIFGLLAVMITINLWRGRGWREQRFYAWIAGVGFLYSAAALALQWVIFHGAHSTFVTTYSGRPPFHTITEKLIAARLLGLFVYRSYLVLPAVVAVAWAIWARNPLMIAGYVAFLPWAALQLAASDEVAGTFSGYYGFPFLVAAAWPLFGAVIEARQRGVSLDRRAAIVGFSAMLAVSFTDVSHQWTDGVPLDLWHGFTTWPSREREADTDRAVALLVADGSSTHASAFGALAVDQGIISLAPYSFPAERHVYILDPRPHTNTVAYFEHGTDSRRARPIILRAGLDRFYRFKGTSIIVASDRDLESVAGLEKLSGPPPPA